jgi:hypothetical protein
MNTREVQKYAVYRHYKGDYYYVLAIAEHTETREMMVVYHALYGEGDTWVRPLDMFLSEAPYDPETNPREQEYRFELVHGFDFHGNY